MGLGSQVWWTRTTETKKKHRNKRRTDEKETQHWLEAMQRTREMAAANAPNTRFWFQFDRECDAWPIIIDADKDGHWFTIRGSYDRRVMLPNGSKTHLRALVAARAVACTYELQVAAGPSRSSRTANMVVRASQATLDFKDKVTNEHFPKTLNVVLAREDGTTPVGERPIEWLLLTNRPIGTVQELMQVVQGYAQRWRVEDFHRTWKSGACDVETMQLHTVDAAKKWAAILAAVATRIERIKLLSRKEPERPASDEFTPIELRAIALLRFGDKANEMIPVGTVPAIKQVVQWIAEIGGYTGKSSGGPPGSVTLSRGLGEVLVVARVLSVLPAICD